MADVLRLVRVDGPARPRLVHDLEVADEIFKLRDTYRFTPAPRRVRSSATDHRYGGSVQTGEAHDNAQVGATWLVKGETHQEAAQRIEALLAQVDNSTPGLYVEHRPEGNLQSVFHEVRGTASWAPTYRAIVWRAARYMTFEIAWPVAPLPELPRMDVLDDFAAADALDDWAFDDGAPTD